MEEKIKELQAKLEADRSLVERLFNLETPEEVQDFLKEQGLDFSLAEINEIRDALVKLAEKAQASPDGELSDADLEDVAGGSAVIAVAAGLLVPFFAVAIHDAVNRRW